MSSISDRLDQLDSVLAGQNAELTDRQLTEEWEDCFRYRDWYTADFLGAEQEYRAWKKVHGGSRDEWHRIERDKLARKP